MKKEYESWFVRKLLWTPSGKIKKVSASELGEWVSSLEENSGDHSEIVFKNYCITDTCMVQRVIL